MMGLHNIRDLVSSLFIMLNKKMFVLFRIEFLVVLITVLFLAMFLMDIIRRHIHNTIMKAIFSLLDAISDSIVIYLLGAMQTAPFKNELFPVWALVLVIFRYSIDFISGYGVPDQGGRRFTEWRNVVKLLGSAFLNWTRGSRFAGPLWSLWVLQILRSWYRLWSRDQALHSMWLGRSSELISEHMREDDSSNWTTAGCNPRTMMGYRYLVYGEIVNLQKPRYVLRIENTSFQREMDTTTITRSSLITLDKIWRCCRHLLLTTSNPQELVDDIQGKDLKDLSLAFSLSRVLRCRLEDVKLHGDIYGINRELVKNTIIQRDAKRAFRILEMQLAFVNDYFNTRYPIVFWGGLYSLSASILLSLLNFGVVLWLSVAIRKVYKPPEDNLAHIVHGVNVPMIITWFFMFFLIFKEIWEMVTYLLSDWTRLLLVCMYAKWDGEFTRNFWNRCTEHLILSFFTFKITAKKWHGLLDQYVFVQSYDYIPKHWNRIHKLTTGMIPMRDNGAKLGNSVDIPDCIRSEILVKIRAVLEVHENFDGTVNADARCLSRVITTLTGARMERYGWACFQLKTSSQVILVWHIATNFCEMALAKEKGVSLNKPGLMSSFLKRITNCCSFKTNDILNLEEELNEKYIIASRLSGYCGYLLVSKPDLIPDSFLVPKMVLQKTVKSSRDNILRYCDSLEGRYNKLCLEAYKASENSNDVKNGEDIVKQGVLLGKLLLDHEVEEGRWEILAGVWVELLIHIAPTWNAEAHKKCLELGGEFITNIWSLLWHCGIDKSSLWRLDDAFENNGSRDPQGNDVGNRNINTEATQQAGVDTRNQRQIRIDVQEEADILEDENHEARNSMSGPNGMQSIESSEIEEVAQGMAANDPNVQTGMAVVQAYPMQE